MDMVWVDTMFPGIDEEDGWEKNLERVVNYDYLLKEYLDWQLKHLTTDNFDQVDWSNVEADIISMAAKSVDLTAYYTKDEADNKAQLTLQAAEDYTTAQLASYYTASEVEGAISTQAGLTLTAAEGYVDTQLQSYYTANQVDGAISAQATLSQQAAEGYVNTALQSYYTASQVDGAISAQAGLTLTAAEGYTDTALGANYTSSQVDGKIGNLGNYATVKAYADAVTSSLTLTASSSSGSTTLTLKDGNTTLSTKTLNINADSIKANASISAPSISGGTISGTTIEGVNIYSSDKDSFFAINSDGWYLQQKTGGTWYTRAQLYQSANEIYLALGNSSPKAVLKKKYENNTHYLWLGNNAETHGLLINLSTGAYSFS